MGEWGLAPSALQTVTTLGSARPVERGGRPVTEGFALSRLLQALPR